MTYPVAHIDLDAFFASVELRRRPDLAGRPMVISSRHPRAVVSTASYPARKHGVCSGMALERAVFLCPQLVIVEPEHAAYRQASTEVMELVRSRIPRIEQLGLDEAYLDLTELDNPELELRRLVQHLLEELQLDVSVGIGANRLVAKLASDDDKPRGFLRLSRRQAQLRFADCSPGRIPGIGPKTLRELEALGLTTICRLAACDPQRLAARFGAARAAGLLELAHFRASAAVRPERPALSESCEATFRHDIDDRDELHEQLARLARQLSGRLDGQAGRTVRLKLRLDDWTTVTRARTLAEPVSGAEAITQVAAQLLDEYGPQRPVRLLGVGLTGFSGRQRQLQLPAELLPSSERQAMGIH